MIVLFTDYGVTGPYVGQMKAVLCRAAPQVPVIDLMHDVPAFGIQGAAYLLAALAGEVSPGSVFLGVVDPGVGSARQAVAVQVDGRWFVGPDNGLFNMVAARGQEVEWWDITWRPARLSASFHGRDLFAPVAARIACGGPVPGGRCLPESRLSPGWSQELPQVIYIDAYGNAVTGIRACSVLSSTALEVHGQVVPRVRVFSDVPPGVPLCYENSNGLLEIAVNQGRADQVLGLAPGDAVVLRER